MSGNGAAPTISEVLNDTFGFPEFRPGQEEVIDTIMGGGNVLAVMPTGSGKSLCYQVPAIALPGVTVVVSPLVALMQDQVAALKLAGVAAETINSSRDRGANIETWRSVSDGTTKLLYLSPERLMTEQMLSALSGLPLSLVVVDEAHCISQWGPAFRPEYADLTRLKELFPETPVAAFTATADEITREDIADKLFSGDARIFVAGFDRPNISLAVEMKRGWKQQLKSFLADHEGQSGIVYCLSRKKTEEAAQLMCDEGIRALPYHAGLDAGTRNRNQDIFLTEPGVVMAATIAFGMGIDKPDVRYVFHTDMPGSVEAYYQEIGRAGRDGAPAEACMLYGLDDMRMRRVFIEDEESTPERKRREHKRLDALIGYCEAPECRRRSLLAYFGETTEPCGNCDVCLNPVPLTDGTVEGQKAPLRRGPHRPAFRRRSHHRRAARQQYREGAERPPRPVADLRRRRGPEERGMALDPAPARRRRISRDRHPGLWRHEDDGRRTRAPEGREDLQLPHRRGAPQAGGKEIRQDTGRRGGVNRRGTDPSRRAKGTSPGTRARAQRPSLCHLLRPFAPGHGPEAPGLSGRVRGRVRRRCVQAARLRGTVPGGNRNCRPAV